MKKPSIFILAFTLLLAISCKSEKKETESTPETEVEQTETNETNQTNSTSSNSIWVELTSKSGSSVTGNAIFEQEGDRVTMTATVKGLEPGLHAIHIHEKSDCSAEDGTSTGGHWNPTGQPHGKWGEESGYHKGDIGNFTANEDGSGTIIFATDEWCIGCGDETKDILGKAVIIHKGVDDFTTQPTGAAGGRVSCGGIIQ